MSGKGESIELVTRTPEEKSEKKGVTIKAGASPANRKSMGLKGDHKGPSALAIGSLLFAASAGETDLIRSILDEGQVDVNDCDYDKRTALHVAASEGNLQTVEILVDYGAELNAHDRWNSSPLDDAIHHGHEEISAYLLKKGATLGAGTNYALELVHAAGTGDLGKVKKLIATGIPVDSTDYDLRTPLHVAIAGRHPEVVDFLLSQKADLHVEDRFGGTPLQEASRSGIRLGDDPIKDVINKHTGSKDSDHVTWGQSFANPFFLFFTAVQLILGVLFALFTTYGEPVSGYGNQTDGISSIVQIYPFYTDVHVMIFVGFGFLMTFLRKNGYTSIAMTFLLGALSIQVYILSAAFWDSIIVANHWEKARINVVTLIKSDFSAGAVLISFGALIGKVTPTQMLSLAILEVFFFSLNEAISLKLRISDIGGSMVIHVFGAFFGLAASKVLTPPKARGHNDNSAVYHSDIFSMIGTVFLWMYWPSFNAALGSGNTQHRAVVNTLLSLTASCVTTFILSQFFRKTKEFNMIDIQNATLAGGVAAGSAADMVLHPAVALLIGIVAGTVSVFGFSRLQSFVEQKFGIHDTCGVLNLHGLPGIIGAIVSVIAAAATGPAFYSDEQLLFVQPGRSDRDAQTQARYQLAFLIITLAIAIITGALSAILLSRLSPPRKFFNDDDAFEVPHREIPYYFDHRGEIIRNKDNEDLPAQVDEKLIKKLEDKIAALDRAVKDQRRTLTMARLPTFPRQAQPVVASPPALVASPAPVSAGNDEMMALLRSIQAKLDKSE
eukprot:TRINITY_DN4839_c0_g1_i1.p1 TRINITY_DN4839_c0_g1~~TRINITY_DN4839_c0_g1_i1.p1  ORF type:complete len:795 (-),score=289.99 TRINITY_DN4839_c0_g1_i1:45-2387(-)